MGVSIPQATETTHPPARASPAPAMSSVDRTCAAGATFVPADPSTTSTQRTSTIELQSRKRIYHTRSSLSSLCLKRHRRPHTIQDTR